MHIAIQMWKDEAETFIEDHVPLLVDGGYIEEASIDYTGYHKNRALEALGVQTSVTVHVHTLDGDLAVSPATLQKALVELGKLNGMPR